MQGGICPNSQDRTEEQTRLKTKRAREGESEVKNVKKRNIKLERMCGESE